MTPMPSGSRRSLLDDEVARFEQDVRRLALEIVRAVFSEELARRQAEAAEPAPRRRGRPRRDVAAAAAAPAITLAEAPAAPKKRGWTREMVIDELATWLLSGTAVEAAFVQRHGRPGLVAGAKRLFGRFDAALNAANLHLAQRAPDETPSP